MQQMRAYTADGYIGKATDDGGYDFILSTEDTDRFGDVIEAQSWKLSSFRKNPIALFAHNHSLPIGTWKNVRIEGKRLIGRLMPADQGTSRLVNEIRELLRQKILRAVSVGFIPGEMEERAAISGYKLKNCELLECSLVSVPANPEALGLAKSANISSMTRQLVFAEPGTQHRGIVRLNSQGEVASPKPRIEAVRQRLQL